MASSRPTGSALFVLLVVAGLSVAAVLLGGVPPPVASTAPATEFSAERAMTHVEQIAQRPHPMGSADHARVRDYIVTTLEHLGVTVERQATTVMRTRGTVRVGRVENVMTRLKGTASTGAVLLATHYDSVPAAPGAADDGSGVAALIETVRALKAGEPPRNDVIVLFTDGEEFGLLGAAAFVDQHPWAKDVRAVVNLEARGTSGPSQMFETGPANGGVVEEWARHVPRPAGSSLTYEVYKRMPNDTDFSVFKTLDVVGVNFAFVGDWENYHTPHDAPAMLDRGSLQHQGAASVALARRFGSVDLKTLRTRDALYFSLPIASVAVRYPAAWALPMSIVAFVLFAWAVIRARGRKSASIGGVVLAFVVFALFGGAAGFWGWRVSRLMDAMHAKWLAPGNVLMSAPYAALLVAAIITVWCGLYVLLRRKFAPHSLLLGSALVWVVAAPAAAWFVPGGSYVLLWPVAGSLLASLVLPGGNGRAGATGGVRALLVSLLAVPVALILWPLVAALFGTMGLASESGLAMALVTVFALASLAAPFEIISEGRRWWPAGLALATTVVCLGLGMALTRYWDVHPRTLDMFYVLDADARVARWTMRVDRTDAWSAQYLGEKPANGRPLAMVPPWSTANGVPGFLNGDAPVIDMAAPAATLVSSSTAAGEGRTLTIHVVPATEGHVLSVWINGAPVLDAAIDGRSIRMDRAPRAADDTAWTADFMNASAAGATITLTVKGLQRITVALVDRSAGVPAIPGRTFQSRPASIIPIQTGDQTIVRRNYTF